MGKKNSGSRNCRSGAVFGSRNRKNTAVSADPEMVEMVRFLDPEIVEKVDKSYIHQQVHRVCSMGAVKK